MLGYLKVGGSQLRAPCSAGYAGQNAHTGAKKKKGLVIKLNFFNLQYRYVFPQLSYKS